MHKKLKPTIAWVVIGVILTGLCLFLLNDSDVNIFPALARSFTLSLSSLLIAAVVTLVLIFIQYFLPEKLQQLFMVSSIGVLILSILVFPSIYAFLVTGSWVPIPFILGVYLRELVVSVITVLSFWLTFQLLRWAYPSTKK